jgi:hypothetical protein
MPVIARSVSFVFIFPLPFDLSEIDEILRLHYSSQMVLVSSPESAIRGVSQCRTYLAPRTVLQLAGAQVLLSEVPIHPDRSDLEDLLFFGFVCSC